MTVSFVSAKTVETKFGYDNQDSYNSSYLLEKKTNQNNSDFKVLSFGHVPSGECPPNPFGTQTGCSCDGGILICYLK